jgi:hypothetical protein
LVLEDLELQKKSIHRGGFFVLRISALKRWIWLMLNM